MEILDTVAVQSPSSSLTVVVAVNISRKSRYAILWALQKFVPEGRKVFKMLHVRPCITSIPTPMGNYVPISQVRDDVATAYKNEMEWRTIRMLRPFKEMFSENKVEVEIVVIEGDDVAQAISGEITKHRICELVIGASSASSMFTRKLKGHNISSRISESTPSFCTVYVVSKGKLSSVRPSETSEAILDGNSEMKITSERSAAIKDEYSDTKSSSERSEAIKDETSSDTSSSIDSFSSYNFSSQADQEEGSVASYSHVKNPPSLDIQRFQALSTINQTLLYKTPPSHHSTTHPSLNIEDRKDSRSSFTSNSETSQSGVSNYRSFHTDYPSWYCDKASTSDVPPNTSSESQVDVNFDLERLRVEIRHVRGMFAVAQNETINASRLLKNVSKRRMDESAKLKEISLREQRARELTREEKEKHEAAKMELELVMECVKTEASRRKEAERKAACDAKEKQKLEKALEDPGQQYKKFKWEEIVSATSSFSDDLKIGMGAYGTVYKCNLQNTTAAVKVLHSKEGHDGNKEFQQELEILSKMRHPHLLLLLGACPDQGGLVYEYMENGNLEDRLLRKNNTPPIPWFDRYRIAWEVASALLFLHNSKPKPIIHRDLKPANILLDHNFVSKIGDVGLSTWLPNINSTVSAVYSDSLVGTLCYIDPEYQRSGSISPKSDVYAFGMVILQLLTAKPALALAYNVETALENGNLMEILDSEAGNWPIEETQELAVMGISCAELSSSDRPDLEAKVLPFLERLKEIADKVRNVAPSVQSAPPNHFICPILKDVMENPCVAADGYTYDRKEIENWLKENEKSPKTNMLLQDKNLIPNYSLLAAIMEWKSRTSDNSNSLDCFGKD